MTVCYSCGWIVKASDWSIGSLVVALMAEEDSHRCRPVARSSSLRQVADSAACFCLIIDAARASKRTAAPSKALGCSTSFLGHCCFVANMAGFQDLDFVEDRSCRSTTSRSSYCLVRNFHMIATARYCWSICCYYATSLDTDSARRRGRLCCLRGHNYCSAASIDIAVHLDKSCCYFDHHCFDFVARSCCSLTIFAGYAARGAAAATVVVALNSIEAAAKFIAFGLERLWGRIVGLRRTSALQRFVMCSNYQMYLTVDLRNSSYSMCRRYCFVESFESVETVMAGLESGVLIERED